MGDYLRVGLHECHNENPNGHYRFGRFLQKPALKISSKLNHLTKGNKVFKWNIIMK
jgi:hypothetical protein